MKKLIDKAAVLIEALPYFQKFRDAILVIKFGGSAMEDRTLIKQTMRDIVFMECVGMKPVVVHGGGKAISAKMKQMDIKTKFINGLRYTCDKTLSVVDDVLHNEVNQHLMNGIDEAGGKGKRISGKEFIKANRLFSPCPKTGKALDLGFVGEITAVETDVIHEAVDKNILPIIPPLGRDDTGQAYNINADTAACNIAEALRARKLVFLSDVPGILRDPEDETTLISSIKVSEVQRLIKEGIIFGGMIPKIHSAISALNAGVNKVHLIDGRMRHSLLLEIFTDSGVGTEIVKD